MSGHSHAKTVRRIKEASAQKRGQIFSKMARLISIAVRKGGANPETNSKLRLAIEMARDYNVPQENIERAIKKATGELAEEKLEEVTFEAYGPAGVALIIEGITDNKNRALTEVKQVLSQYNGKLVGDGAVKWLFERKGCLTIRVINLEKLPIKKKEELELMAIEAGAEDLYWQDETLDVYTKVEDLEKIRKKFQDMGIAIESVTLDWKPKEMIEIGEKEKEDCLKLFEALDELDSVQEIFSNLKV